MDLPTRLYLMARKLQRDEDDIRHLLLNIVDEFLEVSSDSTRFPQSLQDEIAELRKECRRIQPRFKSHRKTSVLFDRAGLGQAGKETARALAGRIIAVHRTCERMTRKAEESETT